jgi:methylmalonyl-CoA mutase
MRIYLCEAMTNNDLFAAFPPVNKTEWLQQVSKDLKGRPLSDFDWMVDSDWAASPFVHADDHISPDFALESSANGWELQELVPATDPAIANAQALEALAGGAEGLVWEFNTPPQWDALQTMFNNIHPDFIGLHFMGTGVSQNPAAVVGYLLQLAESRQISAQALHGSMYYNPAAQSGIIDWRYLAELCLFTSEQIPDFQVITVEMKTQSPVKMLAEALATGNEYFEKLTDRAVSPAQVAASMQFQISIGSDYFLEMSKIRAFKMLWLQVLKAWNAPLAYPLVACRFQPEAFTDDLYTNMIRGTTMAMSAVLGGANRLIVAPYDTGREAQATYPAHFGRRIARNVQHLLKMESGLDSIADPIAGSHYIEQLSLGLANRAWQEFSEG